MRILYVYPHPDDESFGPAAVMARQRRAGHEVHLLTLTKGGATRQRHKLGHSIEEMGAIRHREMLKVERVLDLSGMTVLDFPDSGLQEMDPRQLEQAVESEIARLRPAVVVGYPVHGISGFHDHLVAHAVVKRAFVSARERIPELRRLAFTTVTEEQAKASPHFPLHGSKPEEIDCAVPLEPGDIARAHAALDCYVTFQETIAASGIKEMIRSPAFFEIFAERHDPVLEDLLAGL